MVNATQEDHDRFAEEQALGFQRDLQEEAKKLREQVTRGRSRTRPERGSLPHSKWEDVKKIKFAEEEYDKLQEEARILKEKIVDSVQPPIDAPRLGHRDPWLSCPLCQAEKEEVDLPQPDQEEEDDQEEEKVIVRILDQDTGKVLVETSVPIPDDKGVEVEVVYADGAHVRYYRGD